MHSRAALIGALCAFGLSVPAPGAQTPQDPDVVRARQQLEYTRELVDAGLAARLQLENAQQAVTEAEENSSLKRTLYGQDVSEADADQMVAITARQLERREQALAKATDLVDKGAVARMTLAPLLEQANWARKQHDYAVTRAKLIHEMAAMAREEAELQAKMDSAPGEARGLAERYDGNGSFTTRDFEKLSRAFEREFSKELPVRANGETALHRALGFDHRGRVDVAINPDQPEGVWLRQYLAANHIPYFAFRGAVPGKATGPHIHIGPMSGRVALGRMTWAELKPA
jgi:hypothetical protein